MDNQYGNVQPGMGMPQPGMPMGGMQQPKQPCAFKERNIFVAILLSLVTFGIYGLIWFVKMTDEGNVYANNKSASGGLALLYTLITCGIYAIYWPYKMGQKLHESGINRGVEIKDNAILYLLLSLFGLGFVAEILIQLDLNKIANA